jgi:beta-phosphoglucomutase-like phosphatase (HAD superfamily)
LVRTERLKAISYARAAVEICPEDVKEAEVVEAFKDVVGLSRRKVATSLVELFNLIKKASERMAEFGVDTPWQAYVQVRLQIYNQMLADPSVIRDNQWPHTMALLTQARQTDCKVGLETMSNCQQAQRVLDILALTDTFDFVASRDDVEHGKPDPEMYLMVADQLSVSPKECLVIEDSPTGVKAALNAGMQVLAVSTPFTQKSLHDSKLLPSSHIADDPDHLPGIVGHVVEHINNKNL